MLPLNKRLAINHILGVRVIISDHGLRFIAFHEGIRNNLYDDGGPGIGNATIGVGHLVHEGPIDGRDEETLFVNGLTDEEALRLFRDDVKSFELAVNGAIYQPNQNEFDALCDFAFNCGAGALVNVSNVVNHKGDVCAEIGQYIKPAWAAAALTRRRNDECVLFKAPVEVVDMAISDEDLRKISDIMKLQLMIPPDEYKQMIQAEIRLALELFRQELANTGQLPQPK